MTNTHSKLEMHPERLFSGAAHVAKVAAEIYETVKDLPIVSPHGHTDPSWFNENKNFENATELLIKPDHYVFRMLYSQGITLDQLGISQHGALGNRSTSQQADPLEVWKIFANHYYLFEGTPSGYWLDSTFANAFGFDEKLSADTAVTYYEEINRQLASPEFAPRALMDKFNIELIATTEGALDDLEHHRGIADTPWAKRVITTFRPDDVVDASREDFATNIEKLGQLTACDTQTWAGYLAAIKARRVYFKDQGRATASDHGHPTARTANLSPTECEALFELCVTGEANEAQQEQFRAQMLTELAGMSTEDDLVMQIHPGSYRNHNKDVFDVFGRDKGADIPLATEYVAALKPLLDKYGNHPDLNIILFTLDETSYTRELAPLAGHYPSLKLGPAWWFHDSPAGMLRFRQQTTETAGFYNTVGFNDDTRAFLSIPARHDVARRVDCRYLAELVTNHQLSMESAKQIAYQLTYGLVKKAYNLG